jgi:hypothetical protein
MGVRHEFKASHFTSTEPVPDVEGELRNTKLAFIFADP